MRIDRRGRARPVCAALVVLALSGAAAGCSGGSNDAVDANDAPTTGAANDTIDVASLPPVQPTTAPLSTNASTTVATTPPTTPGPSATSTSTASTSAGPTTAAAATTAAPAPPTSVLATPPCDIDRIVAETGTAYEEVTPEDLRCAGMWATWIGRPADQFADGFFAVAFWTGASWELANLGTAGICEDAGVPADLWGRLGCFE